MVSIRLKNYLIPALILIIGMVFGSIYDSDISHYLYFDLNQPFLGKLISNYLLSFYYFLGFLSGFIVLFTCKKRYQGKALIIWRIIFILLFIGFSYSLLHTYLEFIDLYGLIFGWINNVVMLILILSGAYVTYRFRFKDKYDDIKLFYFAFALVLTIALTFAVNTFIKYLWSRPRPYYVIENSDINFRNFYEIAPFAGLKSTDSRSFPSGHASASGVLIILAYSYLHFIPKFNVSKFKSICFYLIMLFVFVIGFLRMVASMHFLSDVCFGYLESLTIGYFCLKFTNTINKNNI